MATTISASNNNENPAAVQSENIKSENGTQEALPCERIILPQTRDDSECYTEILLDYLKSLRQEISELRRLLQAEQWQDLGKAAHRLKSSALFGYPDLCGTASALERAAKWGDKRRCIDASAEAIIIAEAMLRGLPLIEKNEI